MAKWPNWRRGSRSTYAQAVLGGGGSADAASVADSTLRACGLLMLAVGRLRGWRDYRRRVGAPLRVR